MNEAQFAMARQLAVNAERISLHHAPELQEQQWELITACLERGEGEVLDEALRQAELLGGSEDLLADIAFSVTCRHDPQQPHYFIELFAIPVICALSGFENKTLPDEVEDIEQVMKIMNESPIMESGHMPVQISLLPRLWDACEVMGWTHMDIYRMTRMVEAMMQGQEKVETALPYFEPAPGGEPVPEGTVCVELRFFLGVIAYDGQDDMPFERDDRAEEIEACQEVLEDYLNSTHEGQYMVLEPGSFYGAVPEAASNYQLFLLQYRINMGLKENHVEPKDVSVYLSLHGDTPERIRQIRVAGYASHDPGQMLFNGVWQITPSDRPVQVIDMLTDMLVEEGIIDCHIKPDAVTESSCRVCGKPLFPSSCGLRHMMRQKILQGTSIRN